MYSTPQQKKQKKKKEEPTEQTPSSSNPRERIQIIFSGRQYFDLLLNDHKYLNKLHIDSFVEKETRDGFIVHLHFKGSKVRWTTVRNRYLSFDENCKASDDLKESWVKFDEKDELSTKLRALEAARTVEIAAVKEEFGSEEEDEEEKEEEESLLVSQSRDSEDVCVPCKALGRFLLSLSEEFVQEDLPVPLRPEIGVLMRDTLIHIKDDPEKSWTNIDLETRNRIKMNLLTTLTSPNSPNDSIMNVSADLISIIYAIEHVENGWKDSITLLISIIYEDVEAMKPGILVLRKLCYQMKMKNLTLQKDDASQILSGIHFCLQEKETDDDIKFIAIKALLDSLGFFREIFQNQTMRSKTVNFLLQAMDTNSKQIKIRALKCMIEFVRMYYEYLGQIYAGIWKATSTLIISNEKEISLLAIKVWSAIAAREKEAINDNGENNTFHNITAEVNNLLIPALLKNLLDRIEYEDDDEDGELNVISSTKNCLIAIAEVTKDRFLQKITQFVGNWLLSQNQAELRAGLIAYTCMLDSPSHEFLAAVVVRALPTITTLLVANQNMLIQEAAATALQRTAEIMPSIYFQGSLFSQLFEHLITSLSSHPRISLQMTRLWLSLGKYLVNKLEQQNQQFNIDLTPVIDLLMKNGFRDLEKTYFNLIDSSFLALMTLCKVKPEMKANHIRTLISQFKRTREVAGKKRYLIQAGLLTCLPALLHKLNNLDGPICEEIFNLIMEIFEANNNKMTIEGIHVLCALPPAMGTRLKLFSQKVWPYVLKGLMLYDNLELFNVTLYSLIELAMMCPEETVDHLQNIFTTFSDLLNSKDYNKTLKLEIIMAMGNIALGCKDFILPFLKELIKMYQLAMNAACTLDGSLGEYLEQLRENILESCLCFFRSVSEGENCQDILEFLPSVMEFLAKTCTREYNPSIDYVRNALTLVTDISLKLKDKDHKYCPRNLVVSLVRVLEGLNKAENVEALENAKKVFATTFNPQ